MRYALIESNKVVNVVEQDSVPQIPGTWVFCGNAAPGWIFDGNTFIDPTSLQPSTPSLPNHITQYAFLSRFTTAERIAIRTAAKTSIEIEDYMDMLSKAKYIDLDTPATMTGLATLEYLGLIAPGRATEIRTSPVVDSERS